MLKPIKFLKIFAVLFFIFLIVLVIRGLRFGTPIFSEESIQRANKNLIKINEESTYVENNFKPMTQSFLKGLSIKSISGSHEELIQFQNFIIENYQGKLPDFIFEKKGPEGLLVYHKLLKTHPKVFLAHYDVVPVNESQWSFSPFTPTVQNEHILGRGTRDDKNSIFALMEALVIAQKYFPKQIQSIVFAFGGDEEIGGEKGAKVLSQYLYDKFGTFEFVLDEGLAITDGLVPGINKNIAIIGVVEKGYASYKISQSQEGGHSSMPEPKNGLFKNMGTFIAKLEEAPLKPKLISLKKLYEPLYKDLNFTMKLAFANSDILNPALVHFLSKKGPTNASLRTTLVPTMIKGGIKENVIPKNIEVVYNSRIAPWDSVDSVQKHIASAGVNHNIKITQIEGLMSEPTGKFYKYPLDKNKVFYDIYKSLKEVFPNTVMTTGMVLAATDARHYAPYSKHTLRFTPMVLNNENKNSIHGINESIGTLEYKNMILFYVSLFKASK